MTDRMRHLPCGQAVNSNLGPTHFENLPAIRLRSEKQRCEAQASVCIKMQTEVPSPLSSNILYGKI